MSDHYYIWCDSNRGKAIHQYKINKGETENEEGC